jgi:anti-sigma factor RsiW
MGYWNGDASIESAQKAVSRDARLAAEKTAKRKLADKTLRREAPPGVPRRGRMTRQVLDVPTSLSDKGTRAAVGAFLFAAIGGAIALFSAGMPLKGSTPPGKEGAVAVAGAVTLALAAVGGIVGWFSGRKKADRERFDEDTQTGEEQQ